ncbi:CPBP family intramembrane glutamic endopeptidase [Pradoshia sp.]
MVFVLWALIIFIIIYEPIIGYFGYQRFKNVVKEQTKARSNYYVHIMIGLWLPTISILLLVLFTKLSFNDIGIAIPSIHTDTLGTVLTYSVLLIGLLYISIMVYYLVGYQVSQKVRTKFIEAKDKELNVSYSDILPVTEKEKKIWNYVSLTAGITEEIIYRGFLLFAFSYLFPDLSIWAVIVLSSLLFGLAHTYQGAIGVIRTTIVGIIFSCLYIGMSSIIPLVIIHFLIDYVSKLGESTTDKDIHEEEVRHYR